jgi:hypothetical protein
MVESVATYPTSQKAKDSAIGNWPTASAGQAITGLTG